MSGPRCWRCRADLWGFRPPAGVNVGHGEVGVLITMGGRLSRPHSDPSPLVRPFDFSSPIGSFVGSMPLFKFMNREHAKNLLSLGQVHLPILRSFQEISHTGSLYDPQEGRAYMVADDGAEEKLEVENAYSYSTSSHLLTDSLDFALQEASKETCVMIWDVERFLRLVGASFPELLLIACKPCAYEIHDSGRRLHRSRAEDVRIISWLDRFPQDVAFLKPREYAGQLEVRPVFSLRPGHVAPDFFRRNIPEVSECCLLVDFRDVDRRLLMDRNNPHRRIGARVYGKGGELLVSLAVDRPFEGFSPFVIPDGHPEGHLLGFYSPASDGRPREGLITGTPGRPWVKFGLTHAPGGPDVLGVGLLSEVDHIDMVVE